MPGVLIHSLFAAALAIADPQSPIAPVHITPAAGGAPITVSLTGVEQDPAPLAAKWDAGAACLADVACFVSSWMEANSTGSMEHVLALRAADERADVQKRYADPAMMQRNSTRFNQVQRWNLLGWADYGPARVVFLNKVDQTSDPIYVLTIRKVEGRWAQTDILAADPGFYEIFNRIGRGILERHRRK